MKVILGTESLHFYSYLRELCSWMGFCFFLLRMKEGTLLSFLGLLYFITPKASLLSYWVLLETPKGMNRLDDWEKLPKLRLVLWNLLRVLLVRNPRSPRSVLLL